MPGRNANIAIQKFLRQDSFGDNDVRINVKHVG